MAKAAKSWRASAAYSGCWGIARLHQHLARPLAAPGAARDLRERRVQPLGGAVVGGDQRAVGVQHADQREQREVVALGEQLRADQDVGLAARDALQRARELAAAARAVAVDAHDARLREARGERFLDALRAAAHRLQVEVAAGRAGARDGAFRAAVVAAQPAVGLVQHHARRAARATGGPAAGVAGEHRRVAAPIDEDEALLAARKALADGARAAPAQTRARVFPLRRSSVRTTGRRAPGTARSGSERRS